MSKERCELLVNAKSLAIDKGLDPSEVECPLIDICKGTKCYMFDTFSPKFDPDNYKDERKIIQQKIK
jgi:hypothetical protein